MQAIIFMYIVYECLCVCVCNTRNYGSGQLVINAVGNYSYQLAVTAVVRTSMSAYTYVKLHIHTYAHKYVHNYRLLSQFHDSFQVLLGFLEHCCPHAGSAYSSHLSRCFPRRRSIKSLM